MRTNISPDTLAFIRHLSTSGDHMAEVVLNLLDRFPDTDYQSNALPNAAKFAPGAAIWVADLKQLLFSDGASWVTVPVKEQVLPMSVFGAWSKTGDGTLTNGGGLVGATAAKTEQATGLAQVAGTGGTVFSKLETAQVADPIRAAYGLFPDVPADADAVYFGGAVPFAEFAVDVAQAATYDAAGVLGWQYWNGTAWATLTLAYDNTNAATHDGSLSFTRDGAITFVPPANWASKTVNGQAGYWVRCYIKANKAANMTAVPTANSKRHYLVAPNGGFVVRKAGSINKVRINDGASTLGTANDVKFVLVNFTTGATSGEITKTKALRTQNVTLASPLVVAAGDVLGVVQTAADGTNEPANVLLELGITLS